MIQKLQPESKKRIFFIATREPDYSRVSIVRSGLNQYFDVDEMLSGLRSYRLRILFLSLRLVIAWMTGRLKKSDAVVVGFFAQPIFPLVRYLYRGPIIADAYFSLFDTMVHDKKKARPDSRTGRFCYWLDSYMLRHADLCFTDTQQHVSYLKESFGASDADVRRLWISAESQPLAARPPMNPHKPFRVFFWGGFIPLQGVETIVEAASILKDDNIVFNLFGIGQTFNACAELKRRLYATNVKFSGWQLPENIAKEAAKSHIALGIFGMTEKAGRVIPNKAYEALAMGIPLVTRKSLAADELLEDNVDCLLVDAGDAKQLAEKIVWARQNYEAVCEIGMAGQQLFHEVCSPSKIGQQLGVEIAELLSETKQQTEIENTVVAVSSELASSPTPN